MFCITLDDTSDTDQSIWFQIFCNPSCSKRTFKATWYFFADNIFRYTSKLPERSFTSFIESFGDVLVEIGYDDSNPHTSRRRQQWLVEIRKIFFRGWMSWFPREGSSSGRIGSQCDGCSSGSRALEPSQNLEPRFLGIINCKGFPSVNLRNQQACACCVYFGLDSLDLALKGKKGSFSSV